jgi:hypothetical protein
MSRNRFAVLIPLSVALLGSAACQANDSEADGQEAAEASSAQPQPREDMQEQMALAAEIEEINRQLVAIRDQALQNPELKAMEQEFEQQIEAVIQEIDPENTAHRMQFDSLRVELGAAQQAGDQEKVMSVSMELQTLQTDLNQTENAALANPEVAASIETLRELLFAEMRSIDPRTDSLMNRAEELGGILQAAMANQAAGAAAAAEAAPGEGGS